MDSEAPAWDPGRDGRGKIKAYLRLIRIEHTVFSLPFAYVGAFLAIKSVPDLWICLLIFTALFGLRTASVAYNNIADLKIDGMNPRTRNRPLITGSVTKKEAWIVVVLGSSIFFISAYLLNFYAFALSPVVYLVAMSYPYAKRLHCLPHLHLGAVLGLSVMGGAIGAYGGAAFSLMDALAKVPWDYAVAVSLWIAGVDVVYSIMDEDFDRRFGLGSLPSRLGSRRAVLASLVMHLMSAILLIEGSFRCPLKFVAVPSAVLASILSLGGDLMVLRNLRRVPDVFNMNLLVGILAGLGPILSYL